MTKLEELKVAAWVAALKAATRIEREACAKVCDSMRDSKANMNKAWRNGCGDSADAIRARGEE